MPPEWAEHHGLLHSRTRKLGGSVEPLSTLCGLPCGQKGCAALEKRMIFLAFAVDAVLYAALGTVIMLLIGRRLPPPWNMAAVTIPVIICLGLLLSMATFPRWIVMPWQLPDLLNSWF